MIKRVEIILSTATYTRVKLMMTLYSLAGFEPESQICTQSSNLITDLCRYINPVEQQKRDEINFGRICSKQKMLDSFFLLLFCACNVAISISTEVFLLIPSFFCFFILFYFFIPLPLHVINLHTLPFISQFLFLFLLFLFPSSLIIFCFPSFFFSAFIFRTVIQISLMSLSFFLSFIYFFLSGFTFFI